ncbi:MAG TPA: hypothetical protein DC063_04780 [Arenimonas sp.]|nr:hypothetical protein [Arenimonas sp.]
MSYLWLVLLLAWAAPAPVPLVLDARAVHRLAGPLEARHQLPRGLLRAVVRCEDPTWNAAVVAVRPWGCAVGLGQIAVRRCPPWSVWLLTRARVNLAASAELLADSRRRCRDPKSRPGACPCPWAHYDWGDRTRWCRRVTRALRTRIPPDWGA